MHACKNVLGLLPDLHCTKTTHVCYGVLHETQSVNQHHQLKLHECLHFLIVILTCSYIGFNCPKAHSLYSSGGTYLHNTSLTTLVHSALLTPQLNNYHFSSTLHVPLYCTQSATTHSQHIQLAMHAPYKYSYYYFPHIFQKTGFLFFFQMEN